MSQHADVILSRGTIWRGLGLPLAAALALRDGRVMR